MCDLRLDPVLEVKKKVIKDFIRTFDKIKKWSVKVKKYHIDGNFLKVGNYHGFIKSPLYSKEILKC